MEPGLRQLNERIGARAMLLPLTPQEAFGYLEFRLRACGRSTSRVFEPGAAHYIVEHSGGIPRRINVLAHNALLLAYSTNIPRVDLKSARAAVAEFTNLLATKRRLTPQRPGRLWFRFSLAAVALAMLTLLVFALGLSGVWPQINLGLSDDIKLKPFDFSKTGSFVKHISASSSSPRPATELPARQVIESHNNAVDGKAPPISPRVLAAISSSKARPTNSREVRVQWGDTLEHIAIEYLGSEDALQNLIAANPQLHNVDQIYPGEIVHLPVESDAQE
jgi:LysM repeat protein